MQCQQCDKILWETYGAEWVSITKQKTWSCPEGSGGSATVYAAVFCSLSCARRELMCITTETKTPDTTKQR